jgi:hypothetical protein
MPLDHDLPALSQPTLPPPNMVSTANLSLGRKRLALGAVAVVAVLMGGAYLMLGGHDRRPEAQQASRPPPADLEERIERTLASLPAQSIDRPCTSAPGRVPLVLHASADARRGDAPNALDASLFPQALPLAAIGVRLPTASRLAMVRTLTAEEPRASVGSPQAGRYEGQLVVIDTASGAVLCHSRVLAWSSAWVVEPGISERALRDDFADRVEAALFEAAARLHVDVDL